MLKNGSLIVDVGGPELTAEDREVLEHPAIGGVILFSRNWVDPEQLQALTADIHTLKRSAKYPLVISCDHEGGRVQRFRAPFTALPAASQLYQAWCSSQKKGRALAEQTGWLMSAELRSVGVDFSYAPVLDLDYGVSEVIGDRSFGPEVEPIVDLAGALFKGLQYGSLPAVGKHFPGHGYVVADSHLELPRDERPLAEMMGRDIEVFKRCFALGIHAVMTAHVVYAEVDELPATFSPIWLRQILRQQLGFAGCIFSDDLSMKATSHLGDSLTRCEQAASAGCDSILICNDRSSVVSVLDQGQFEGRGGLLNQWLGKQCAIPDWKALKASADYQNRRAQLERWMDSLSVSG